MRRKWKKASKWGLCPAKNLWWYRSSTKPPNDDAPTADALAVIDLYLYWAARGRTLPKDFRAHLLGWLQDLTRPVKMKSGTLRYWTIPNFAKAKGLEPYTLMKRTRRLAEIASELFPKRAPIVRAPLTEKEIEEIHLRYYEGVDIRQIAKEFNITPARVGQLCSNLKSLKQAVRELERQREEKAPASVGFDSEEPF